MSNKITGKDLGKMIKEALLNERGISLPKDRPENKVSGNKWGEDYLKTTNFHYPSVKDHRKVLKVQSLAGLDNNPKTIDPLDIEKGRESNDSDMQGYADAWLDGILKGSSGNKAPFRGLEVELSKSSKRKGLNKINQTQSNFVVVLRNYLANGDQAKAKDVWSDIAKLRKAGDPRMKGIGEDAIKELRDLVNGYTADRGSEVLAAIDKLITITNPSLKASDRKYSDVAGSIDISSFEAEPGISSTASGFGGKKIQIDSALQSQFDVFDFSQGLPGFFDQVRETAEAIKNQNFPTNADDAFEFVIKANFVNRMANLSKMYDYSSGGFELEKLLTVALGGAKIGGDGGAADVLLNLATGKALHTSQKFVTTDSSEQSYKNTVQLLKTGKKLFYTFFKKTGGSNTPTEYNSVDLYISSIYTTDVGNPKIGKDDPDKTTIFISDLQPNKGFTEPRAAKLNSEGKITIKPAIKFATIPLIDSPSADPNVVADYISGQIMQSTGAFKDMAEAIIKSFKLIRNIERNTQEYNATRANPKAGKGLPAQDYVNEIAEDYVQMRNNYKKIFSPAEQKAATSRATSTDAAESPFTEQKVTSDLLKKIIKETLKK